MILFEGETEIFFCSRSCEREIVYFDVLESWKGRGIPNRPGILLCLGPLGTLFFASARDTRAEPSSFPKLSDEPFEEEVQCDVKNEIALRPRTKRVNRRGSSHSGVTFSSTRVTNHARCNRSYISPRQWCRQRDRQGEREIEQIIGGR